MKTLAPLALISAIVISGCASHSDNSVNQKTSDSFLPTPILEYHYRCESGNTVTARYPTAELASIKYNTDVYTMKIEVSASGSRYVGGGFEWWTKALDTGSEGALLLNLPDGTSGEVIELCVAHTS